MIRKHGTSFEAREAIRVEVGDVDSNLVPMEHVKIALVQSLYQTISHIKLYGQYHCPRPDAERAFYVHRWHPTVCFGARICCTTYHKTTYVKRARQTIYGLIYAPVSRQPCAFLKAMWCSPRPSKGSMEMLQSTWLQ
jgi:hypothetical protein